MISVFFIVFISTKKMISRFNKHKGEYMLSSQIQIHQAQTAEISSAKPPIRVPPLRIRGLFGWWGKWGKCVKITLNLPLRCQTCGANVVGQMFCPLNSIYPKKLVKLEQICGGSRSPSLIHIHIYHSIQTPQGANISRGNWEGQIIFLGVNIYPYHPNSARVPWIAVVDWRKVVKRWIFCFVRY
jgi:hypothetical protein